MAQIPRSASGMGQDILSYAYDLIVRLKRRYPALEFMCFVMPYEREVKQRLGMHEIKELERRIAKAMQREFAAASEDMMKKRAEYERLREL